jgi:two-component system LytT family response regulator
MQLVEAILVDDDPSNRKNLRLLLEADHPEIQILAEATNGAEALACIKTHQPQLVFLDVEMPDMTGFDVLEKVEDRQFEVVFVTGYDKYALRAFKFSAIDYVLKPIDRQELTASIRKVKTKISGQQRSHELENLLYNLSANDQQKKLAIPSGDRLEYIQINEIVRCEAEANYTHIHLTSQKTLMVAKTLKEIEALLYGYGFFRVHQSYLINLKEVVSFVKSDGGYVITSDGNKNRVARQKKKELIDQLSLI